ncbi:hypothetical protein FVER14953_20225 [Fusarium verticillioides]|nr:hypothetical protein FVER14953_20225 [Fusarium verticillioides]
MATRILNYIYISMELAVVPVYQSEIMPREIRGFASGTLIVAYVCRGTSTLSGNLSIRIPFGLFFIPESPR